MWWLYRMWSHLRRLPEGARDPHRLARSLALGLVLGLVPKSSGAFAVVGLVAFGISTHLPTLFVTALAASILAPWLDPCTGAIGERLLLWPVLHPVWARLHRWPLVPWLRLNNTVVMGSLVLGIVLAVVVHRLTQRCARRWLHEKPAKEKPKEETEPASEEASKPAESAESVAPADARDPSEPAGKVESDDSAESDGVPDAVESEASEESEELAESMLWCPRVDVSGYLPAPHRPERAVDCERTEHRL